MGRFSRPLQDYRDEQTARAWDEECYRQARQRASGNAESVRDHPDNYVADPIRERAEGNE